VALTAEREREVEPWRFSRRGERLPDQCLDCGAAMVGPYCATCGQKNEPEHRSLWQLLKDAVGPAVLLEGKLWRTLWVLLRHPGALSAAYTEGKRSRYIRPLRLYFWVSVLCFSAMALRPAPPVEIRIGEGDRIQISFAPKLEEQLQKKLENFRDQPAHGGTAEPGPEALAARARLRSEFASRLPKAIFLLLPFFALVLRLLWRRRPYVDQLIFALHAHTVFFIGLGVGFIPFKPVTIVARVFPLVWLFPALRRFYGSGWVVTILKALALCLLYVVVLFFGVMITALLALLGT